jgi:hypothetical protein
VSAPTRPSLPRRLLDGWLVVAGHFGEAQTLVLLGIVYVAVIGPVAAVSRVFGADFLAKRHLRETGSAWRDADTAETSLERSKHPF